MTDGKFEDVTLIGNRRRNSSDCQLIQVPDQSGTLIQLTKHTRPPSVSNHAKHRHKLRKLTERKSNHEADAVIVYKSKGGNTGINIM